ncbi:hypothetical protein ES703_95572 [subsurface metagenome]
MVPGAGSSEKVESNAQLLPAVEELYLVKIGNLRRVLPFLLGFNGYRSTVLVRAGYHQYFIAFDTMVAGKDIRRQIASGNLSQVQRAVGIRPGDPDENSLAHT